MSRRTPMVNCRCPRCPRVTRAASGLCHAHHQAALSAGLLVPGRLVPVYSADLEQVAQIARLPRTRASVARLAARAARLEARLAAAEKRLAEIEGGR